MELKPCPVCGGKAELFTPDWAKSHLTGAYCTGCGATSDTFHEKDAVVIAAWNTRASLWHPASDTPPDGARILIYAPDFSDSGEEYQVLKWDSRCNGLEEWTHWMLITKPEE